MLCGNLNFVPVTQGMGTIFGAALVAVPLALASLGLWFRRLSNVEVEELHSLNVEDAWAMASLQAGEDHCGGIFTHFSPTTQPNVSWEVWCTALRYGQMGGTGGSMPLKLGEPAFFQGRLLSVKAEVAFSRVDDDYACSSF